MHSTSVSLVEADMHGIAAAAAAAAINSLRAHAAIHLDGHNGDSMIAAFALHPAPLQASNVLCRSTYTWNRYYANCNATSQRS